MNTDRITANFAFHEFERSAKAEQNGLDNTIASSFDPDKVRSNIRALVENVLQPIRDAVAEPVSISSGYRSPEVNRLAGGSATSHHKSGKAADIHTSGRTPLQLAQLVIENALPFDQMILHDTFLHIGYNPPRNRHQILYDKTYKGKRL